VSKHTQGKWKAIRNSEDGGFTLAMGTRLRSNSMFNVVHCVEMYDGIYPEDKADYAEAKANARLMAAAPDMLEVLEALVRGYNKAPLAEFQSSLSDLACAAAQAIKLAKVGTR
jgi:hypothetical protein